MMPVQQYRQLELLDRFHTPCVTQKGRILNHAGQCCHLAKKIETDSESGVYRKIEISTADELSRGVL